jgi:sugar-specific transcriptional regulator TrmB
MRERSETGSSSSEPDLDFPPPSPDVLEAYRWVALHQRLDLARAAAATGLPPERLRGAVDSLIEWGLVSPASGDPQRLRAVDPDLVAAALATPAEETIRRERVRLEEFRARFSALREHYTEGQHSRDLGVELIPRLEEVRAALTAMSAQCRNELLTSQPGGNRDPDVLADALDRDRVTLSRGVRMRTLYHHTARFNGPSQAYVAAVTALGAEVRTAHELFGRLIIFDREVAFIPEADDTWGAIRIREPSIVRYLYTIFEQTWWQAEPFSDAASDGLEAVARDIDRTIARLLAAGLKDETIARRLGMSLRTARRHIADIMESLGAESRFQAGYVLATQGLLADDAD